MLYLRREPEFTGRRFHHHHEHAAVGHAAGGFHPERTDYRQESAGHCLRGGRCLAAHPWKQPEPAGRFVCQPYGNMGDLLVLFAQFCYAFYIVRFKDFVNKYSLITIMKWMFTYSFICTIPFSASDLMNADWGGLKAVEIGSLTFIVVGATFVSYMLIVVGQKNLRPTVAGMYNYIQPLVACIVAVCWGMDSFNTTKIIAVVLIFGGVYLVTSSRSRKEMEAYKQAQAERE